MRLQKQYVLKYGRSCIGENNVNAVSKLSFRFSLLIFQFDYDPWTVGWQYITELHLLKNMSAERTSLQCKPNCLPYFFYIRYLTKHEDLLKFLMFQVPTNWPVSGHESKLNFWSRANLYYNKEISYFTLCNTDILSTYSKTENLNYTTLKPNLHASMIYFNFFILKYVYWHHI